MSELADKAVSGDKQSFTDFRKLTACGIALVAGGPGAAAAVAADKSVFQKAVQYAVGKGELAADEAVESLIDRGATHLSTILHNSISHAVTVGCCMAGTLVGGIFGPIGAKIGATVGLKVAGLLNTNISTLIEKGVAKVRDVARNVYHKGKEWLKNAASKVKSFLFG